MQLNSVNNSLKLNTTNANQKSNFRNGWIELVRLIAITSVLLCHFRSHEPLIVGYWPDFEFGVTLFMLISGFCNYKSTKIRSGKFFIKILIYTFYAILIQLIFYYGLHWTDVNPFAWIINFEIPSFDYTSYWYVYVYAFVSIFFPIINKYVAKINKWILFVVCCVSLLCLFSWKICFFTGRWFYNLFNIWQICLFVTVYSLGVWFAINYKEKISCNKKATWISLGLIIVSCLWMVFYSTITKIFDQNQIRYSLFNVFMVFVCNFGFLTFFASIKPVKVKWVNDIFCYIGWIVLGIYLTHAFAFIIVGHLFFNNPVSTYSCGYFVGKFLSFFLGSIILSIIMTHFVHLHEKLIFKFYNNYKEKKAKLVNNNKQEK